MSEQQKKLRITLTRSVIGTLRKHRATVKALGLHRMHQTVEQVDTPAIRGMIHQVQYLLTVEEVEG
jgi:large subunit ribosomal protein L30